MDFNLFSFVLDGNSDIFSDKRISVVLEVQHCNMAGKTVGTGEAIGGSIRCLECFICCFLPLIGKICSSFGSSGGVLRNGHLYWNILKGLQFYSSTNRWPALVLARPLFLDSFVAGSLAVVESLARSAGCHSFACMVRVGECAGIA